MGTGGEVGKGDRNMSEQPKKIIKSGKPLSDDTLEKVSGGYGSGACPVLRSMHVYKDNYCIYCSARDPSAPIDPSSPKGNTTDGDVYIDFNFLP